MLFKTVANSHFWSSSSPSPGDAWVVSLDYGGADYSYENILGTCNVRCILNTSAPANNGMWSPIAYEDATNQTARYYVSGTAPNAIVTDDFTGLMWEQQVSNLTYFWNASAPAGSAQAYCKGLTKGGYTDWRLPTWFELITLVGYNLNCSDRALNPNIFVNPPDTLYWTSTPLAGTPEQAWYVSFSDTNDQTGGVCTGAYCGGAASSARCVRCPSLNSVIDRYSFNSTQVKDIVTGLIWQRVVDTTTYSWSNSVAYCNALGLDGETWRLPNAKELATLVDSSVASPGPTINVTAFQGIQSSYYWSSTRSSCSSNKAWSIWFSGGHLSNYDIGNPQYARCVRGPQPR